MRLHVDLSDLHDCRAAFREVAGKMDTLVLIPQVRKAGQQITMAVRRKLVEETGLPSRQIAAAVRAMPAGTTFTIEATGGFTRVGFGARQTAMGVAHSAWGRRQVARGAFVQGGMAYKRLGKARYPIKPLFGPSIPREMERGESFNVCLAMCQRMLVPAIAKATDRQIAIAARKRGL